MSGMTPLQNAYFVRNLVARGHEIDVLTQQPSLKHPIYKLDSNMNALIPTAVRLHRTYAGPLHHLARFIVPNGVGLATIRSLQAQGAKVGWKQRAALFVRHLLIPDSRVDWLPWALVAGLKLIFSRRYDVIFSIAPPDTDTVIGFVLSRITGLPWVVHQGDLWSFGPATESQKLPNWRRWLDRKIEGRLLQRMDKIIVLTPEMRDLFLAHFPALNRERFTETTVGYDAQQYNLVPAEPPSPCKFRVVYTGIFYEGIRDPYEFFAAMADFCKESDDVELIIAGNVGTQYRQCVKELGIEPITTFLGQQPHDRVIALQKGASVLLLLCWVGGYGFAAKTVEYLAAKRPILAIDYDGKDPAARVIKNLRRGAVVENARVKIHEVLGQLYALWKSKQLDTTFSLGEVPDFTWERVVDKVEAALQTASKVRSVSSGRRQECPPPR